MVQNRFADSQFSAGGWSSYELNRLGIRHDQVHEQNRHELWEQRNELQRQVEEFQEELERIQTRQQEATTQLEAVLSGLNGRETEAAMALQDVVLGLLDDSDDLVDLGDERDAGSDAGEAPRCSREAARARATRHDLLLWRPGSHSQDCGSLP